MTKRFTNLGTTKKRKTSLQILLSTMKNGQNPVPLTNQLQDLWEDRKELAQWFYCQDGEKSYRKEKVDMGTLKGTAKSL